MLGQVAMIDQSQPYDIDHRTQLVCKYLKAKKEDKLNQLAQRKLSCADLSDDRYYCVILFRKERKIN